VSDPHVRLSLTGVGLDLNGRRVLHDIDLVLEGGEAAALTGPSGSGKTVLCLLLGAALPPSSGTVRLEGTVNGGIGSTGLILQTHGLVSGLTAEENVALPLQVHSLSREEVRRRTAQALVDVGLERHAARPVDELSGGERQRVGIARALAADPTVLVADEPTGELDPGNRERVLGLLIAHAQRGRIVVIASDDGEVVAKCSKAIELFGGTITGCREVLPTGG
jgi:putative ABC transport system ATP-binding protein